MTQPTPDPTVSQPGPEDLALLAWLGTDTASETAEKAVVGFYGAGRVEGFGRALVDAVAAAVRATPDPTNDRFAAWAIQLAARAVTNRYYGAAYEQPFAWACLDDLRDTYARTVLPTAPRG